MKRIRTEVFGSREAMWNYILDVDRSGTHQITGLPPTCVWTPDGQQQSRYSAILYESCDQLHAFDELIHEGSFAEEEIQVLRSALVDLKEWDIQLMTIGDAYMQIQICNMKEGLQTPRETCKRFNSWIGRRRGAGGSAGPQPMPFHREHDWLWFGIS